MMLRISVAILSSILAVLGTVSVVRAESQTIPIIGRGWHFVSLQVQPFPDDPASVFGAGYYDHVWAFEPGSGWFHHSPNPALTKFNDLDRIKAFQGYWIHATEPHPNGGIVVDGQRPAIFEIVGAGWHARGVFRGSGSLTEAFSPLDALSLQTAIQEIWTFEGDPPTGPTPIPGGGGGAFRKVFSAGGPAPQCPGEDCLQAGRGYWFLMNENLLVGQEISSPTECITITPRSTSGQVDVQYRGVDAGQAILRATNRCVQRGSGATCASGQVRCCSMDSQVACQTDADCTQPAPATLLLNSRSEIAGSDGTEGEDSGSTIYSPDFTGGRADGPDPSACPVKTCGAGTPGCVDICFKDASSLPANDRGRRTHSLFITIPDDQLLALASGGTFTTCEKPYTSFVLEQITSAAGNGAGGASEAVTRKVIRVAVQPPILDGTYAGRLVYEGRGGAGSEIPIHMVVNGCTTPGSGTNKSRDCTTSKVTAIINPLIEASTSNAIDDDGDGSIDEQDESGATIPQRKALSFPRELVLHGELSQDDRYLRFAGRGLLPPLQFAELLDGKRPPDAGLAQLYEGANRALSFEGQRIGLESFRGIFSEVYEGAEGGLSANGFFELARVTSPQCIARDNPGDSASSTVTLGALCRDKDDCPKRCFYSDAPRKSSGIPCSDVSDCPTICYDEFNRITACDGPHVGPEYHRDTCESYPCGFLTAAPNTHSGHASDHGDGLVRVAFDPPAGTPANRRGVIELAGPGLPVSRIVEINTPSCTANAQCKSGRCSGGNCKCSTSGDCAAGQSCSKGGTCLAFSGMSFSDLPCGLYTVRISFDGCGDQGTSRPIEKKICWCDGAPSCTSVGECPEGWGCANKQCTPPTSLCPDGSGRSIDLSIAEADCPTRYCELSRTVCTSDVDCNNDTKMCRPTGGRCATENDCPKVCSTAVGSNPPALGSTRTPCQSDATCNADPFTLFRFCRSHCAPTRERCLAGLPPAPAVVTDRMTPTETGINVAVVGGFHAAVAEHCVHPKSQGGVISPEQRACRLSCGSCGTTPARTLVAPVEIAERIRCGQDGDCPQGATCTATLPDTTAKFCSSCGDCSDVVGYELFGTAGQHIVGGLNARVEQTLVVTDVEQQPLLQTGLAPRLWE